MINQAVIDTNMSHINSFGCGSGSAQEQNATGSFLQGQNLITTGCKNPSAFSFHGCSKGAPHVFTTVGEGLNAKPCTTSDASQVSMSESKGTPFSKKTPVASVTGTCVKVRKQGVDRYSSSPLGKRIDIYETSETEDDHSIANLKSLNSDSAQVKTKSIEIKN